MAEDSRSRPRRSTGRDLPVLRARDRPRQSRAPTSPSSAFPTARPTASPRSPTTRAPCRRPCGRRATAWYAASSATTSTSAVRSTPASRCAPWTAATCSTASRRSRFGSAARPKKSAGPPHTQSKAYGVGLACVSTVFGSGSDPAFALVEIDRAGRISSPRRPSRSAPGLRPRSRCAWPTSSEPPPTRCRLGVLDGWDVLGLVDAGQSVHHHRASSRMQRRRIRAGYPTSRRTPPRRSPLTSTPQSPPRQRTSILRFGLWPAALAIWSAGNSGGQAAGEFLRFEDVPFCRWPLDRRRHGAACASPPRRQGARDGARHRCDGARLQSLVLGACHLRSSRRALRGRDRCAWRQIRRRRIAGTQGADDDAGLSAASIASRLRFRRRCSSGSASATRRRAARVVAVEIDKATGAVSILDAVTVLECGRALVPQQVAGQAEGGFAMGVGYALHEHLPLYEDGPGNGTWNLDRYRVPRASDLPVWNLEIDVLPPLGPTDVPKGIAELVMIPVAPAILNAIADAIGKRFDALPVTADDHQGGARMKTHVHQHDGERGRRRPPRDPGRALDERLSARISQSDRHQVRLRHRCLQRLRRHPRRMRTEHRARFTPASPAPTSSPASRFAPSRASPRTAS